jgi:hypothetical protein
LARAEGSLSFNHCEKLGTGHGEQFLVAAEWGSVESQCSDDDYVWVVWVIILEHNLEFVGVGGAGSGVLEIVGMNIGRHGGRGGGGGESWGWLIVQRRNAKVASASCRYCECIADG